MSTIIKNPETKEEFKIYYNLRWKILRKPLGEKLGKEKDNRENESIHLMMKNLDKNNVLAVGRLHFINVSNAEAQIRFMAVDEEYQGRGYGSLILNHLEKIAKEKGSMKILLHAREASLDFYKKNGYVIKKKSHLLLERIQHWLMIKEL